MTLGEIPFKSDSAAMRKYVEPERDEINMLFQFDVFDIDCDPGRKLIPSDWNLPDLKRKITKW
jgi:oligo-1,6-glucosidase